MFNPITTGSHFPKLRILAIALHLCCIVLKVARGRPISFHLLHFAQEFGLGRLAKTAKREARETFSLWMRQSFAVSAPHIQASKLLVVLAALAFALAQEATAQSGRSLEGGTVGDLGNPHNSLFKVPAGGAVPLGSCVLHVVSGNGGGMYPTGAMVIVSADSPPTGQQFARWEGDIAILSNPFLPTTTATMPSMNVSLSATYADPEGAAGSRSSLVMERSTPTPIPTPAPTPIPTPTPIPRGCISNSCKCKLKVKVVDAPKDKDGLTRYVTFEWKHDKQCADCDGQNVVISDRGVPIQTLGLGESPATVDLERPHYTGLRTAGGTITVKCAGNCGLSASATF
jgi:hypothetical protein